MTKLLEISIASGRLNYRLLETDGHFGLEINCTLFDADDKIIINDITTNEVLAQRILYLLADNAVLPVNATDVIVDIISDTYSLAS